MRASARKSFGEYKSMIVHGSGRTEIVRQRVYLEIGQPETKFYSGPSEVWHARRGGTQEAGGPEKPTKKSFPRRALP